MVGELPSEAQIGEMILTDVADDFAHRVFRLQTLIAFDADFGEPHVLLPGGQAAYTAYVEARSSFVSGNFLATILLSQSLVEQLLGGHLVLDDVGREVRRQGGRAAKPMGERPRLKELIEHAIEAGVVEESDSRDIERLIDLRNPLVHFRGVNDAQNLTRRAMEAGVHPNQIMYEDARFAILTVIRIVMKAQAAFGRFV